MRDRTDNLCDGIEIARDDDDDDDDDDDSVEG